MLKRIAGLLHIWLGLAQHLERLDTSVWLVPTPRSVSGPACAHLGAASDLCQFIRHTLSKRRRELPHGALAWPERAGRDEKACGGARREPGAPSSRSSAQ